MSSFRALGHLVFHRLPMMPNTSEGRFDSALFEVSTGTLASSDQVGLHMVVFASSTLRLFFALVALALQVVANAHHSTPP